MPGNTRSHDHRWANNSAEQLACSIAKFQRERDTYYGNHLLWRDIGNAVSNIIRRQWTDGLLGRLTSITAEIYNSTDLDSLSPTISIRLQTLAQLLQREHIELSKLEREAKTQREETYGNSTQPKKLYHSLRPPTPAPLSCATRLSPTDAQASKNMPPLTNAPLNADEIARARCEHVYNTTDPIPCIESFLTTFGKFLQLRDAFPHQQITGQIVMDAMKKASNSASGLDQLSLEDMRLWSCAFCNQVPLVLGAIENGKPWPTKRQVAKLAGLAKDNQAAALGDVMAFRWIAILPRLYRLWASISLMRLGEWSTAWIHPSILAGIPGRGSEDGAYASAVDIEYCRLHSIPYVCDITDLQKCFDRIFRPLLYLLLRISGFSPATFQAYIAYHEGLQNRFALRGSLGKPHTHKRGIPQGCPLSMLLVAFFLRPLAVYVDFMGASARLMADDVFIHVAGDEHINDLTRAFNDVLFFFDSIGAQSPTFPALLPPRGTTSGAALGANMHRSSLSLRMTEA